MIGPRRWGSPARQAMQQVNQEALLGCRLGGDGWQATHAQNISGHHMDLVSTELGCLCRHHIGFAVLDDVDDGGLAPAVQPVVIGQVGRANGFVALAVQAVAGRASRKLLFAVEGLDFIGGAARQGQHVMRHIGDVGKPGQCCGHGRHHAGTAVGHRLDNVRGRALTQPCGVAVGEVGVALAAAGVFVTPKAPPASMRSNSRPSSCAVQTALRTLIEVMRPQIVNIFYLKI